MHLRITLLLECAGVIPKVATLAHEKMLLD